jgi:pimeloyl-ACP methyl ester carboxylesterase
MSRALRVILIVLAAVIVLVGIVPLLVPVPALDTVPPQELAGPNSQFVTVNVRGVEVDVHTEQMGDGEPVFVLLHGFLSSTFTWREVMQPLAQYGTVIAADWMPYGLTERPLPREWRGGESPYTRDAQVDLTVGLLDALGIERAILIGNSAGGALAAAVAYQHPERVEALVLVDAAVFVPGSAPDERRGGFFGLLSSPLVRALGATPQMRHVGPLLVRSVRDWGLEFGRSAWHDPAKITDDIWAGYTLPLRADNWDRALYEGLIAPPSQADVAGHLDALTLPTLVVTGDDDRIVPTANSIALAEALPQADLAVFEACGHVPQEECPDQFMAALEGFLSEMGITRR